MGIFSKKKQVEEGIPPKLRESMDNMLATAADEMLDEELLEAGRQDIEVRLKQIGVEFNSKNLRILMSGMEFMLTATRMGDDNDKDLTMPALMMVAKLMQVEKGIESAPTTSV